MTPILKKKLHWLPVRHCIVYKILSLVFKAINVAVPYCISDSLNYRTSKRTLWSSFQHLLATTKVRLKDILKPIFLKKLITPFNKYV